MPLTTALADAFRSEFLDLREAFMRASHYADLRTLRGRLSDLGRAWTLLVGEPLTLGLTQSIGLERSRKAIARLVLSPETWSAPLEEVDPSLPRERAERLAIDRFMREVASWTRRVGPAAERAFETLHALAAAHRVTLYYPKTETFSIEGASVSLDPMTPELAARSVDTLGEALRILRTQRRVPWLADRLPPIRIVQDCKGIASSFHAAWDLDSRTIELCAAFAAKEPPVRVAWAVAHEAGHGIWRTRLGGDAIAEWESLVKGATRSVSAFSVLAAWPRSFSAGQFLAAQRSLRPAMYLALHGAMERGSMRGLRSREALVDLVQKDPAAMLELSASPVSVYGAKNPEEAFCEALAHLAAYGPRAVLPEVQQWLRAVVPTVRPKANGRKHNGADAELEGSLRHFADPHEMAWTLRGAPWLANEFDDIVARLLSAGAKPPLSYQGAGGFGFVVCDARGRGFKASRTRTKVDMRSLADEAEWLRVASTEPAIREHVARFYRWHPAEGVIERECLRAKDREKVRTFGLDTKLWNLHQTIRRVMLRNGWTAPEFKTDSYVVTRDRGPVLVDAGLAARVGVALAHEVADLHRAGSTATPFDREFGRGMIRSEYGRSIPHDVGVRLHDRLATKPNSAVAARHLSRDVEVEEVDDWGDLRKRVHTEESTVPAHLTDGHWQEPAVIEAARTAGSTARGYSKHLGEGNFGIGYRAETPSGALAFVKVPAAHNIHKQPWTRAEQTSNLMQEAGVANELRALGYTVVPEGVYTEWGGGTPAWVREFGEPVTSLTPEEYSSLEAELMSIERDAQWRVVDELQLFRRPDGSVFVGDVGIWQAPSRRTKKAWSDQDSSLRNLLEQAQQKLVPGLAWREKRTAREGYEYADRVPVATLPTLVRDAKWVLEIEQEQREEADRYEGKTGPMWRKMDGEQAARYLAAIAARDAIGFSTPAAERAVAGVARVVLERANGSFDESNDGKRKSNHARRAVR